MATVPAGPLCTSLSSIKKAPKWTLGGREEDKAVAKRNRLGPGPGAYVCQNLSVDARHSRPPSAVFSVEKRDAFANQAGKRPSVGTYTPNFWSSSTMPIAGRALFSKSSRDDAGSMTGSTRRAQTPGPGSYSIKPAFSDISASMYGRAKDLKRPTTPGPGAYSISRDLTGPAWKLPMSARPTPRRSESPGPGQYLNPTAIGKDHPSIMSTPRFSMVPRRSDRGGRALSPGPGAHGGAFTTFGY
mmetsp:Transcript_7575/g.18253  ORF Transcript_7575/g.18253 Transcript_7575/m.18253 type:complete len:243 (+) Transcript_7575:311-1039(+)|eukprot:CAMPEP_0178994668 /NCGR_PEP_ID=MMETSP0795-20121207/7397_1 /TAXON_ID=88552 /ORGANISM="Amoebophrya sp., Strain Ameob2" /LENGTH=242 /DNA_ID=CAMNT_0020686885 /DNA_START=251 /DNA_END=979 /DNA_ORIENTATION=-